MGGLKWCDKNTKAEFMKRIKYISAKQKAKRKRRKTDASAWIVHTLRKPANTQLESLFAGTTRQKKYRQT